MNEVKELVYEMKRTGVIGLSQDPWSSPVRFCVDYRELNDVTRRIVTRSIR